MFSLKNKKIVLSLGVISSLCVMNANASDITVKMLNNGANGSMMTFEPAFVKAKIGDTVTFESAQPGGHNVRSLAVPKGSASFVSKPDEKFSYKIEKAGLYLYACDPHKIMGMAGLIQVGKPSNLDEVKKVIATEEPNLVMNKDAYKKLLSQVK